ncbi:GreA/GreB family elongation factor [Ammoniphilus sp. YIM 78166]|uniref:GreA/GreB family elongation factor n=1 Tax=Ammoniphilus sp. YIM 78166 TaxID=1644106 RepID=UPI00142FC344|nr:GreA/GreB family elongation factor [Ammoniphilus sp. YIM 78166]
MRRSLIQQLVFIDENRLGLIDMYLAATPGKEKDYHFFGRYILEVEKFLRDFDYSFSPKLDTVFIGSEVTLLYIEENQLVQYTICFPEQVNPDSQHISLFSPIGRQIILKGINESILLTTPDGEANVMIKDIQFKLYS